MKYRDESEDKLRHGELKQAVLAALGIGLLVGGTLISPNFPIILGTIIKVVQSFRKVEIPKKKIIRVLKTLEKKEIIYIEEKGDEVFVRLRNKGNNSVLRYSLKAILDFKKKEKKWKGKWFLVLFDVPEEQRNKRNYLRKFLKDIGFYQYQQSVYLFPYECEKEISLVKKIVEGGKYMSYLIAEKIENEDKAKNYFSLINTN